MNTTTSANKEIILFSKQRKLNIYPRLFRRVSSVVGGKIHTRINENSEEKKSLKIARARRTMKNNAISNEKRTELRERLAVYIEDLAKLNKTGKTIGIYLSNTQATIRLDNRFITGHKVVKFESLDAEHVKERLVQFIKDLMKITA